MIPIARPLVAVFLLGLLMVAPAQAAIVYSQTADYPSSYNALTSQSQGSGGGYEAYDSFNLSAAATVKAVTFQGFYWNPNGPALNPPPLPGTQDLQVGFYTNSGSNLPGTFLGATNLTNFQSAKVGTSYFGPDNTGQNDLVDIYNFVGNLVAPFNFSAHTQYWMSIVSFAGPTPPYWLWTSGSGGDGHSLQFRYVVPAYANISRDRAFSLSDEEFVGTLLGADGPSDPPTGELVEMPEPGSLTLLALGAVCGAGAHLRRRLKRDCASSSC